MYIRPLAYMNLSQLNSVLCVYLIFIFYNCLFFLFIFFFFNDTATTEIYTLSLHDALPIFVRQALPVHGVQHGMAGAVGRGAGALNRRLAEVSRHAAEGALVDLALARAREGHADRKSTRLNSSHVEISYAVFCLKKKKKR